MLCHLNSSVCAPSERLLMLSVNHESMKEREREEEGEREEEWLMDILLGISPLLSSLLSRKLKVQLNRDHLQQRCAHFR